MQNIKEFTVKELEEKLKALGFQAYNARQIFSWIYKNEVLDFKQMSNLPQGLREALAKEFYISGLKLEKLIEASDGTQKFLLKLSDANLIEAVVIPAEGRVTACLSTQVGCKYACKFCASGSLGFKRNLSCAEIIKELLILKKYSKQGRITHVVFMGTGEPLDNYDNLLKAVRIINAPYSLNIGARRITISTAGVIPAIQKLAGEGLQIELSISLHAADDKLRSELMPINKKYPLKDLIKAARDYSVKTNRQVTLEYILIKDVNSDLKDAQDLSRLLKGWRLCKVNLIPANVIEKLKIEPPVRAQIQMFKDYLTKQGVIVTLRKERGKDIDAACGQLRL